MASRADNIASNLSLANFSKATELKNRIWFTLGALIVFRFLTFVPLPGIDPIKLKEFIERGSGVILDFLNIFSGGALSHYSLNSLGGYGVTAFPLSAAVAIVAARPVAERTVLVVSGAGMACLMALAMLDVYVP